MPPYRESAEAGRVYCKECLYLQDGRWCHSPMRPVAYTYYERKQPLVSCQDKNSENNCAWFVRKPAIPTKPERKKPGPGAGWPAVGPEAAALGVIALLTLGVAWVIAWFH